MNLCADPIAYMPKQQDTVLIIAMLSKVRDHADFTGGEWGPDTAQLAAWLRRPYQTVKKYADRLLDQGMVELIGAKRWLRLTPAGRRHLAMLVSKS